MKQFHKFNLDFEYLLEIKRTIFFSKRAHKAQTHFLYTKAHQFAWKTSFHLHFNEIIMNSRQWHQDLFCYFDIFTCWSVLFRRKSFRKNWNIKIFDFLCLCLCFCIRATTNRYCFRIGRLPNFCFPQHTASSECRLPQP